MEKNGFFKKHLLQQLKPPNEDIERLLGYVNNGVIQESQEKQNLHVTSSLTHPRICLYAK